MFEKDVSGFEDCRGIIVLCEWFKVVGETVCFMIEIIYDEINKSLNDVGNKLGVGGFSTRA